MKTAVFPGSFDPFTLGHLDVLTSALKLFDKIIVAVGFNVQKAGYFSVEERVRIIKESVKGMENIVVDSYSGLTIDYCNKAGAGFIVRGLRTTTDFELERVIAQANYKMNPDITTVFIPSGPEFAFITSTVVRDVLVNGGCIDSFMAKGVKIERNEKNL
ncbi:MAG: pantetheine-phosphate adenylyltransferase [Bacteroidia bacterium]|uniref:Phosphopantetheine adenylyltransferase n=1 Tax=bioreactor metagenome TaxID=1076179 RepID=A0A644ZH14_9ZZZZ|nr:pantetheine-phosphate adenylyltransferase [Rikenellaceae bacterium]NCB18571.1 pantetheine-phosphate adenylyltransferase [Bacteroidia bacterium]